MTSTNSGESAAVGRVRRAFGLKGELLIHPFTNEPGAIFAPGRRVFAGSEAWTVERSRPFKDGIIVKFDVVADRTAAESLRATELTVPIGELPEPDPNEVFLHELPGMTVTDAALGALGTVASFYELPQGLVLEVRGGAWRADVPFNEAFVLEVDRTARTIGVRLPEGLAERVSGSA